jgi:hypothetical protein
MDIPFNNLNYDDLWRKPVEEYIEYYHISPENEEKIKLLAVDMLDNNLSTIVDIINKVIKHESNKISIDNLRKRALIRNQIIYNITENIKKLALNIAKEEYEKKNYKNYMQLPVNYYFYQTVNSYNNYDLECNETILDNIDNINNIDN